MAKAMVNEKILIVAPNWIGDAVLSLPVVDASAGLWPQAELTVLARPGTSEIFSAGKPAVKVLEYHWGVGHHKLGSLLKWGLRLRRERYHTAVLLPNSLGTAMLVRMAGIPQRAGYATDGRGWLLTHQLPDRRKERGLHQVNYYIELIRSMGANQVDLTPRLKLKPDFVRRADTWLSDLEVRKNDVLIGVHPGAAYGEAKRWFPERFGAVLGRLKKSGRQFVLFGGPGEETLAEKVCKQMSVRPINLVGNTTVTEALALISRCSLFLSNDSGLMHVAAALGIPQLALFGSTDPEKTAPLNDQAVVIHPKEVSCTPCFKRHCPQNLECMEAITVDEVHAAAEQILAKIESYPEPIN